MSKSLVCLLALFAYAASSAVQELSLAGVIQDRAGACLPGQACYSTPQGPNVTIVHGDKSMSCLWLVCAADSWTLVLESPPSARYAEIGFVGRQAGKVQAPACATSVYHVDQAVHVPDRNKGFGTVGAPRIQHSLSYPSCGTTQGSRRLANRPANAPSNQVFENTVHLLEYVHPNGPVVGPREKAVYLTSLTIIDIKCCRSTDSGEPVGCSPGGGVPALVLEDCNEKQFELQCGVDAANELFKCEIGLKKDETLGTTQAGFYVESCSASIETEASCVSLVENSKYANADLEVRLSSSGSGKDLKYQLQSAFFQKPNSDLTPMPVTIQCTIKLALAAEAEANQWPKSAAGPFLPSGKAGDENLIQAGKITLLK